jgi:hypothetical protein
MKVAWQRASNNDKKYIRARYDVTAMLLILSLVQALALGALSVYFKVVLKNRGL